MPVSAVLCVRAYHLILYLYLSSGAKGVISTYNIIHHIPYFSSVCSPPESNSCSCADRAHNLKKRDANHWEKGDHSGARFDLCTVYGHIHQHSKVDQ